MLIEIGCNKFSKEITNDGFVRFHEGLNIVLGGMHADNSVGKTTFLMAIDYAFGSTEYGKDDAGLRDNVGTHVIQFAHQFGDEVYFYSRDIDNNKVVNICNEHYEVVDQIPLDRFTSFMSQKYGVDRFGISFRNLITGFFRIYGKDNYDVTHPLKAFSNDNEKKGIDRLLKLHSMYDGLKQAMDVLAESENRQKALKNAIKYDLLSDSIRKREYEKNTLRILEIDNEIKSIEQNNKISEVNAEVIKSQRLQALEVEKLHYNRLLLHYKQQLAMVNAEKEFDAKFKSQDLDALAYYFPNANLEKIAEVENFHKGLTKILSGQFKSEHNNITEIISKLYDKIKVIDEEIHKLNELKTISSVVLHQYLSLAKEKSTLEKDNNAYLMRKALGDDIKNKKESCDKLSKNCIEELNDKINTKLDIANQFVCHGEKNAPSIDIKSLTQYSYGIHNDTGTGSQTRGLCLFDIVMLTNTVLPAIVHDSNFLKQIEDAQMLKIMELYNAANNKQVFIAIDKLSSYDDNGIPELVNQSVVLRLSKGKELYGMAWSNK